VVIWVFILKKRENGKREKRREKTGKEKRENR
jgi:hypothetical protein